MRKKIPDARTTRENQRMFRAVPTAGKTGSLTGSAPLAANTKANPLQQPLKIGIDLMGNDNAPQDLLAALNGIPLPEGVGLVAIGAPEFEQYRGSLHYVTAPEVIGMEEPPLLALRRKKNASINVGMRLLKEGEALRFGLRWQYGGARLIGQNDPLHSARHSPPLPPRLDADQKKSGGGPRRRSQRTS